MMSKTIDQFATPKHKIMLILKLKPTKTIFGQTVERCIGGDIYNFQRPSS